MLHPYTLPNVWTPQLLIFWGKEGRKVERVKRKNSNPNAIDSAQPRRDWGASSIQKVRLEWAKLSMEQAQPSFPWL